MANCTHCGALIPAEASACPACGAQVVKEPSARAGPHGGAMVGRRNEPSARAMDHFATSRAPRTVTLGRAIAALLLNIFVVPGLGSLVGRARSWPYQLGLAALGWVLLVVSDGGVDPTLYPLVFLGFLAYLAAWVWALVTSIRLMRAATRREGDVGGRFRVRRPSA